MTLRLRRWLVPSTAAMIILPLLWAHLFMASSTVYVLVDRFGCYRLDLDRQSLREVQGVQEFKLGLIGTFDEDPQSGHDRFIRSENVQPSSDAAIPDCR